MPKNIIEEKIDNHTITKYEDVKHITTEEYFNDNIFSIDVFNKKYALYNGETYVQALKRVCDYIASVEKTEANKKYWSERWFDEIYNDWWHPAGSIMQGANSGKGISLANCTHISLGGNSEKEEWDNLESIIKNTAYTVAKTAAYRQGLGVDFSRLRPKGLSVKNSSKESTGAIHWMKYIDSIGYFVGQSGRIPAFLFSLSINHPDIIDFINVKSDYTQIQNANISVQCTDKFYKAVEKDEDWKMVFEIPEIKKGQKVYVDIHSINKDCKVDKNGKYYYIAKRNRPYEKIEKKEKARKILELIAKNMYNNAEPGIQNIDIAKKYSNSDYVYDENDEYNSKIIGTNACSEQYLSRESLCVLSSINAVKFSVDENKMKEELKKIGYSINRFLDNVNECELQYETYATPHQKIAIEKLRRTGAGVTNIGAYLFKNNVEYGTEKGNAIIENFMKWYNYYLYESTIKLGKEKGNFGLFNKEKFTQSPFIKRMEKMGLEFDTARNVTCSSIAPTGTLSLLFRDLVFSYGIEPSFGIYFWKRTRISGKYEYYFCVPSIVHDVFKEHGLEIPMKSHTIKDTWDGEYGKEIAKFIDDNIKKIGIKFRNATEVPVMEKLDLMSRVSKWIDSSISVTYMLPENTNWKDIYNFIIEAHKKEVKSIAAFPDRKMYGIVSYIPFKELAFKLRAEGIKIHEQNFTKEEYEELIGNAIAENKVEQITYKKRPKTLDAEAYHVKVKGEDYFVIVGLDENKLPYEVFSGKNNVLPKNIVKGKIQKIKRGQYAFVDNEENIILDNISDLCKDDEEALTRITSTSLRHGVNISFIVHQLEKVEGNLTSLSKAIARSLKRYIEDGTKVYGEVCKNCGASDLSRGEGCVVCVNCGMSKCS